MTDTLVVECVGGLTNRLMALTSGLRLANIYGMAFKIAWEPATECGAEFSDLFSNLFDTVSPRDRGDYPNAIHIGHGAHGWNVDPVLARPPLGENFWLTTHGIITHPHEPRNRSFFPDDGVIFDIGRYSRVLRPNGSVQATVDSIEFDPCNTVSLHIRRPYSRDVKISDGAHANEQRLYGSISDDYFAGIVEAILRQDARLRVLLSTNSEETQAVIKARFGDKVITYAKSSNALDTSQVNSARDALVDIILMSKTAGIVRQVDTHFGLYASLINQTPNLVIIRNDDREPDLGFLRFGDNQQMEFDRSDKALPRFCERNINMLRY